MKKTIALMLLLAMLVMSFAACEDSDGSSDQSDAGVSENVSGGDEIKTAVKDLGGREINVLCHDFATGLQYLFGYSGEIMYAEENPSAVDEAKKRVVDYVENTYNCKINGELTTAVGGGESVEDKVKNQVTAGLHFYDIVFDTLGRAPVLASDDMLLDLNSVPNIDLSDPWWDQNAVKDLSIDGKVYFKSKTRVAPGSFVDVRVDEVVDYDVYGTAVLPE